jgi:hypothetical protein
MSASEPTLQRKTSYIRIPPSPRAAELEAGLLERSEIERKEAVCEKVGCGACFSYVVIEFCLHHGVLRVQI